MNFKNLFIILGSVAVILGIIAFFVVFSPGTYDLTSSSNASSSGLAPLSFGGLAGDSGTTATANGNVSSSASSTAPNASSSAANGDFQTTYSYPYVVNWSDGQAAYSITGAEMQGNQIVFALKIQIGNIGGCIPLNLRLVTDESGDVSAPDQSQFTFPDTQSCTATPNAAYNNQSVSFTLASSTPSPYLFTTGGDSNQFFEVATTTAGVQVSLPGTSG